MVVVAGRGVVVVEVVEGGGVAVVEFWQDATSGEGGPLTQLGQLEKVGKKFFLLNSADEVYLANCPQ